MADHIWGGDVSARQAPAKGWLARTLRSRPGIAVISSLATATLLAGIAVAAGGIPDADGVIHACYHRNSGELRVIDPATSQCRQNEVPLSFNQQGPAGVATTVLCPECELEAADLAGAQLPGAFLRRGYITVTMFANANLVGADMTESIGANANFSGANLVGANFSGARLPDFRCPGCVITQTTFSGANLTRAIFDNAIGGGIVITQTIVSQSSFEGARLSDANFTRSVITQTIWTGAHLVRPNFTDANLSGARGLDDASLVNPIWANTTCPDGTNSDRNDGTCEGHLTPIVID